MRFPDGFLWGAATAAYQIEGAVAEDGRGPSIWDTFSHTPGAVLRGDTGDVACDHYHRWREDLDLLGELGVGAYRLSVAWPRVVPAGAGPVNPAGLDFYERLVDGLLERGITPMLTLYHWDLPQALQDAGGWANRDTAAHFADYAAVVHRRLGDRVPYWLTLNEPYCSAVVGHLDGRHAPGVRDERVAVTAVHHLLLAHGRAVAALRADGVTGQVGITCNLTSVHPASETPADVAAARRLDLHENRMYLDPLFRGAYPADAEAYYAPVTDFGFVHDGDLDLIAAPLDFFGINYYERHHVRADPADPERGWQRVPPARPTVTGIGVHPEGLAEILERVSREYTGLPLVVTETGLALHDYAGPDGEIADDERIAFFEGHLRAAHGAMTRGVSLLGFFPWSFLDNFEWASGYGVRYGLYYVDYPTQRRTPKRSARWYATVIRVNGLP
ncbi:GH1 family beta-glucosidase [Dactylosporangium sp. AC04546]|uniref:GH1 family beta-glucosidase n=1 Tax=Dactylosporangium sp. AC04546 TaxID=2862460 RepID=UPI001EDDFEC9|nr:GH1 family beta-glucosidase [Dactylosporangium sp. AC04546]WVK81220.1 GH1 family beta-glucosidase [Dactylosporangium sp. AC04546]